MLHASILWQCIYLIPTILFMPFVYILYFFLPFLDMFTPFNKIYAYYSNPLPIFVSHTISYILFLCLLIETVLETSMFGRRVPDVKWVDVVIWLYVVSLISADFRTLYFYGLKAYRRDWWMIYGVIMEVLFVTSFMARFASFKMAENKGPEYKEESRILWPSEDPMLISEVLYAVAVVMAYGELVRLLRISRHTGPIHISLGRMLADFVQVHTHICTDEGLWLKA